MLKMPFLIDKRALPGTVLIIVLACILWLGFQSSMAWGLLFFFLPLHLAFFRDPRRQPHGEGVLSPADGKVVEISFCEEKRFLNCRAVKIGIFLSVLDVHVNRMPWPGTFVWQEYVPGKFLNALSPDAALKNESHWMGFRDEERHFLVRQISGLIARHIHFDIQTGDKLQRGDKIGMICYGSRAEIYLPADQFKTTVQLGDVVKVSETLLGDWIHVSR